MRLIDRYVFGIFLRVFLICFVCLAGIYVLGDYVGNLNEFIDASEQHGGMLTVLRQYYAARIPWFFDLIGRVAALIAAVFAVTWLQRHNEMTALMAAGISRWRILRPLIWGVALVSALGVVNREAVLPHFRESLGRRIRDWSSENTRPVNPRYDHFSDILIDGQEIVTAEKKIVRPVFRLPLAMHEFADQLRAETARRLPPGRDHPAGYLLQDVSDPHDIDAKQNFLVDDHPLIYTPADTAWLPSGHCFVVSQVALGQLVDGRSWRNFASTPDLIAGIRNPSLNVGADVRVAVHARIVQPILDLGLFFLGIPVVLSREQRNVFVSAGSCILIVATFFIVVLACHNLGHHYLIPPARAAWLPVMIIVPWAVASSSPLRR